MRSPPRRPCCPPRAVASSGASASQTTTATSLPDSGAATTIGFDTVAEDPYSGWDSGTFLWTPPAGYSGWYQATLTVRTVTVAANVNLRPLLAGTYGQALATPPGCL